MIDDNKLTVMKSLDISAAFDTINHGKLLSRFRGEFGVTDMALKWLKSCIEDRQQFVKFGDDTVLQTVHCTSRRTTGLSSWPTRHRHGCVSDWLGHQQAWVGHHRYMPMIYTALPSNNCLNHSFQSCLPLKYVFKLSNAAWFFDNNL